MPSHLTDPERPLDDHGLVAVALEHAGVGIAVISLPDLVYEYVNPAFQAFAPGKEMIGLRNDEVFPEMGFLESEVLSSIEHVGQSWRAENVHNRIRRTHDGPLEDVYGTFEVTLVRVHDAPHLLVTATETTRASQIAKDYERLSEEEAHRLTFASTMERVNGVIHSSLDYDEVMQRSLEEATVALGARAGAVFVGLKDESEARYVYGFPRSLVGRKFPADMFPFSALMEERKTPIAVEAEDMGQLMNPLIARLFRVRSLLAIPLIVRGELAGGIGLIYREPHHFDPAEIDFAGSFGASVSLALENAELYRREERVADTLQEALLLLPEHIAGLTFAHAYNSASEAVKVGGDFYDLFDLEDDHVGITVGDISGKGLEAAVLTSLVKHAVRTKAIDEQNSPAAVLRVVNRVLFEGSASESFATAFFAILDRGTGHLAYCNAGHTTALVSRADGRVDRLGSTSSVLGAFAHTPFVDEETIVGAGDVLLIYTDGVTEARSGKEFFGEERVVDSMRDAGAAGPGAIVEGLLERVKAFTGGHLSDDVAVLAVSLG